MISPFYNWLKNMIDKEVKINVAGREGGRGTSYQGKLLYVDKQTFAVLERDEVSVALLSEIDELSFDKQYFKTKSVVKVKEMK